MDHPPTGALTFDGKVLTAKQDGPKAPQHADVTKEDTLVTGGSVGVTFKRCPPEVKLSAGCRHVEKRSQVADGSPEVFHGLGPPSEW